MIMSLRRLLATLRLCRNDILTDIRGEDSIVGREIARKSAISVH